VTRVSICIAGALALAAALGCSDSAETRFKRAMRDAERAQNALKDRLESGRASDVAATQRALRGVAAEIAEIFERPDVAGFRDEPEFRAFARQLHDDALALESDVSAGKLEDAASAGLPRIAAGCAQCHDRYRKRRD
jgi:cytochrome c556